VTNKINKQVNPSYRVSHS